MMSIYPNAGGVFLFVFCSLVYGGDFQVLVVKLILFSLITNNYLMGT